MRVLGLDITPQGIFAVAIDTAFGRFEVRDTQEMLFDPIVDPATVDRIAAARQLIDSYPKAPDRIVVAVPSEVSTFRNVQIATKDKKAIRSAVEFEIEDDLPFEKDQLHYDSVILNLASQGSTIHVGAIRKDIMQKLVSDYSAHGIEPDVMTTEVWAFRCLVSRFQSQIPAGTPVAPMMILGMEDHKTFIYIHQDNQPILYRELSFGRRTIEAHLENTLNAGPGEAAVWIRDIGLSGVDENIGRSIAECLDPLISEIRQCELSARSVLNVTIDTLYLTGDLALIPSLSDWVEGAIGKRAELFRPLRSLSTNALSYSDTTEIRFARAAGLALAAVSADKLPALNLRKGLFLKAGAANDDLTTAVKQLLPYAAIILVTFFSTKLIESQYYKTKLEATDDTLRIAVKNYFGGISDGAARTYLSNPSKLKQNIQTDLAKERELSKLLTGDKNSPFDLLKQLSNKIGKDIVLDLESFQSGLDDNNPYQEKHSLPTQLNFVVSNPQNLARLTDLLEKSFKFKKGQSEETKLEGRTVYKISFSGDLSP
jgi:type IV pilus assembly protein PilM